MTPNKRTAATTSSLAALLLLWALVVVAGLFARPLLPIDETRYLSVAWDMWLHHNWLVPHLNGEPYPHKPPMLFWLINAGWAVFGVNDFTARLVAPVFAGLNLVMVMVLAGRLWPENANARILAPLFLAGGTYFAGYGSLTYFDMLQSFCALLGWYGILVATDGRMRAGWIIAGVAMGLGILTKGPVILLYVLPVALFAPFWMRDWSGLSSGAKMPSWLPFGRGKAAGSTAASTPVGETASTSMPNWKSWYIGMGASILLCAVIGLAWAVPAGIYGGAVYRNAIFWGQTAGRMVDSFAHVEPIYYYLVALPLMLLPWLLWGGLWRALFGFNWTRDLDRGLRLAIIMIVVLMLAFSLISGKRVHYILPVLPLVSLVFARILGEGRGHRFDLLPLAAFVILVGVVGVVAPFLPRFFHKIPAWVGMLDGWWGIFLIAAGAALLFARAGRLATVRMIAMVSLLLVAMVFLIAAPRLAVDYNMQPLAHYLKGQQDQGRDIAYWGKYHAQFQFLGRLQRPVAMLETQKEMADWLQMHPDGEVIARRNDLKFADERPLAGFDYRNHYFVVWDGQTVQKDPARILTR
jgi:4-amino-4-deoxy-L-arabinose transferase-like glycosyltransferase